jgi:hypothetical protein
MSERVPIAEAARVLGYSSSSGVRNIVRRGELMPAGYGPHGYVFDSSELRRFLETCLARHRRDVQGVMLAGGVPSGGTHEKGKNEGRHTPSRRRMVCDPNRPDRSQNGTPDGTKKTTALRPHAVHHSG